MSPSSAGTLAAWSKNGTFSSCGGAPQAHEQLLKNRSAGVCTSVSRLALNEIEQAELLTCDNVLGKFLEDFGFKDSQSEASESDPQQLPAQQAVKQVTDR